MVKELDAGAVLKTAERKLDPRETSETLSEKLSRMGAKLIEQTLLEPLEPKEQPAEGITLCGLLERKDGECDVAVMTAEEIDRKVRAFTPWPGVTMSVDGVAMKILECNVSEQKGSQPVACKDGTVLHVVTLQEPGKKPMKGADWARGRKI